MVENLVRPTPGALVAMQQIADWLKTLGTSEYTDRFVENRIDLSVLPDLTDQELEKLGVLLGDRRKMLRAIRNLDNVSVAATAPAATVAPELTLPLSLRLCRSE
jgi:SAM domain (Sterile alpha motif)